MSLLINDSFDCVDDCSLWNGSLWHLNNSGDDTDLVIHGLF